MGGCCSALVHVNEQEWTRWADHPVRQEYGVVMDLGEGAFSLVSPVCRTICSCYNRRYPLSAEAHVSGHLASLHCASLPQNLSTFSCLPCKSTKIGSGMAILAPQPHPQNSSHMHRPSRYKCARHPSSDDTVWRCLACTLHLCLIS